MLCVGCSTLFLLLVLDGACASSSGGNPAVLGECVSMRDASCSANSSGGGGAGSSGGSSDSGTGTGDAAEQGCGTAGAALNAANNQCPTCISTYCCLAAAACTGQCLQLLSCSSGINACETTYPQGISAYNDLSACLTLNCPTQCPTLPMSSPGDF